jgi:hypothetical protein
LALTDAARIYRGNARGRSTAEGSLAADCLAASTTVATIAAASGAHPRDRDAEEFPNWRRQNRPMIIDINIRKAPNVEIQFTTVLRGKQEN